MKFYQLKNFIPAWLLCAFFLLLTAACTSLRTDPNTWITEKAHDFTPIVEQRAVLLYPDKPTESPQMTIALTVLNIPGQSEARQCILDVLYQGKNPREYADTMLYAYDRRYMEMRGVVEIFPDMSGEALNWYYHEDFAIRAGTPQVLVMSREREYFTGGAHGMREKDYFVFDLENKRQLTLKDIIRDESLPDLHTLVEAALRELMQIPAWIPLSEGGFFEDSVTILDDFFLTPQGMGFQWDPYEIAPYVMGLLEITLPYDKLEALFTDRGMALIKRFR
jgi:hypothetical protein